MFGEAAIDQFGSATAISSDGTVFAASSPFNVGANNLTGCGRVKVYNINSITQQWEQMGLSIDGTVLRDGEITNIRFGSSLALSADGQIVAIGALGASASVAGTGYAEVYKFNGYSWTRIGQKIEGENIGDRFGYSISLSDDGTILAVGADLNDASVNGVNVSNGGHVRVFKLIGLVWTQIGQDIDGGGQAQTSSGKSISLSADGTMVAIGEPGNEPNVTSYSTLNYGTARVYKFNSQSNIWEKKGSDIHGNTFIEGKFGTSVSLSDDGNIVAIGGPGVTSAGSGTSGAYTTNSYVKVFNYNVGSSSWIQMGSDINGGASYDYFGISVSLNYDGTIIAIGASYVDSSGNDSGQTKVYKWNGSSWNQFGQNLNGQYTSDKAGNSVSLSKKGTVLVVGEIGTGLTNSTNHGRVMVYTSLLVPYITPYNTLTKTIGISPFTIVTPQPTDVSIVQASFSYKSYNLSIAEINNTLMTIVGVGSAIINATREETTTHMAARIYINLTVVDSTEINPVIINNVDELLFFMSHQNSEYCNITNSTNIYNSLIQLTKKRVFINK